MINSLTSSFLNQYRKNDDISNISYDNYFKLLSYQKVKARLNIEKHVFKLNDFYFDSNNLNGVYLSKQSSVENMFFFSISPSNNKNIIELHNKNLSPNFYYQLCLFFQKNSCLNYNYSNYLFEKNLYIKKEIYLTNIILPFYLRKIIIPKSIADLIIQNYKLFKNILLDKITTNPNKCTFLFLGAQNNWDNYNSELLNILKKDSNNLCINNIINNIEQKNYNNSITDLEKTSNIKNILINFLENYNYKKIDFDLLFENNEINFQDLAKHKDESNYSELINFLLDNNINYINEKRKLIIQITYLLSSLHKNEILNLLNSKKNILINILKDYDINENTDSDLNTQKSLILEFFILNEQILLTI